MLVRIDLLPHDWLIRHFQLQAGVPKQVGSERMKAHWNLRPQPLLALLERSGALEHSGAFWSSLFRAQCYRKKPARVGACSCHSTALRHLILQIQDLIDTPLSKALNPTLLLGVCLLLSLINCKLLFYKSVS